MEKHSKLIYSEFLKTKPYLVFWMGLRLCWGVPGQMVNYGWRFSAKRFPRPAGWE